MKRTDRIRELATALRSGSAREGDVQELCELLLADPAERVLTDGELVALGLLAIAREMGAGRDTPWSRATIALADTLTRRGVL